MGMIIKKLSIIFFLLMTMSCDAKSFGGLDNFLSEKFDIKKEPHQTPPEKKQAEKAVPNKKIVLVKDKNGHFQVSWKLLREYNNDDNTLGKNLKKVINKKIIIDGYMIPLDYSQKKIKEFLLVPYIPNCSHVPPPPNNNIINVKVGDKAGIKPSYWPVKIEGHLKLSPKKKQTKDEMAYMPSGVFILLAHKIEELK